MSKSVMNALFLAALVAAASPVAAFHSGGVGSCNGCHATHKDKNDPTVPSEPFLLRGANSTETCLRCHGTTYGNTWGQSVVDPGPQYGGGSFVFLQEDNINDGPNGSQPTDWIPGYQAGHNVVAPSKGILPDTLHLTAPGGSYPSTSLHCTSCHDPHGKNGHFRMLYGSDSDPSNAMGYPFKYTVPAPTAQGIDVEGAAESKSNHSAYNSGMTEWCGSCHGNYHEGAGSGFQHPSGGTLGGAMISTYNSYRGTGFLDGDGTDSYEPLVPVEDPSITRDFRGPIPGTAKLTCLSCHRAHASSAPDSGRWDFKITTWAEEGVNSGSWPIPNPYSATSGPDQRCLCEKCHGTCNP